MVKNYHRYREKLKFETEAKERGQKILDFIKIEIIIVEQQKYP